MYLISVPVRLLGILCSVENSFSALSVETSFSVLSVENSFSALSGENKWAECPPSTLIPPLRLLDFGTQGTETTFLKTKKALLLQIFDVFNEFPFFG